MKRTFLTTTAVAALLVAGTALAQDSSMSSSMEDPMMSSSEMPMTSSEMPMASSEMPMDSMSSSEMPMGSMSSEMPMTDSSMMSSEPMDTVTTPMRTPVDVLAGYTVVDSDQLVSRILNMPVYNGEGDDAEQVGTINDFILNGNGEVAAVVLGVGGFLGLGEKQVAVDYTALKFTVATDNTERYVLATTVDELTSAPDFQVVDDDDGANDSSMSSAQ